MPKRFWTNEKTETSFRTLGFIKGKADFVLIGGWAVHYYSGRQPSEDVDIALGYDAVNFFKRYGIRDYGGINIKYSIIDSTVVDLFIEEYADIDLPVPVSTILHNYTVLDGIKVVDKELLLLLKLWGYFREDIMKIRKDIVDVVSLLFYADIDLDAFKRYVAEYKIERRRSSDVLLKYLDKAEPLSEFICNTENEYRPLKEKLKKQIRKVFNYD
jgi:hypothetical protein